MKDFRDVIVIGGGLAGLTAALHLAEAGLSPVVLEASERWGGRFAPGADVEFRYNSKDWEFPTEHAVHGIWDGYSNFFRLVNSLPTPPEMNAAIEEAWTYGKGGKFSQVGAGSAIRSGWIPAPLHFLQLFLRPRFWGMLGLSDIARLPAVLYGLFYCLAMDPYKHSTALVGKSLDELIRHWGPATRAFMVGLTRNGLSAQPEQIPISGFIAFMRFYNLMSRRSWRFSYLDDPSGIEIIFQIQKEVARRGATLILDSPVSGLSAIDGGWEVNGEEVSWQARHVIIATDVKNASQLLARSDLTSELTDLEWPEAVAPAVLRVWFSRQPEHRYPAGIFSGDLLLDNFFWLDMIYASYRRWQEETGGSVIEVHIYGPADIIARPEAWLLAMALNEIGLVYPELRGARVHHSLIRHDQSHTVFEIGQPGKHPETSTHWPSLYFAGDWVRHPHPSLFLERAIVTGIAASNAILTQYQIAQTDIMDPPPPEPMARTIETILRTGGKIRRRWRAFMTKSSS